LRNKYRLDEEIDSPGSVYPFRVRISKYLALLGDGILESQLKDYVERRERIGNIRFSGFLGVLGWDLSERGVSVCG
jgi:hypothetical protein